jgi:addiction module RelE/StbE family toxin
MVRLRWTLPALKDLDNIAAYIANDAPQRASRFVKDIIKTAERLRDFPLSGRIIPDMLNPILRELIYHNYRIMYKYHNDLVEILSVFHSARHFDDSLID